MKVRRLEMKSFRGFRELSVEFNGQVTVLVGINGAGKTSILDCLAVLLSPIHQAVLQGITGPQFQTADIHINEHHTLNTVELSFAGQLFRWSRAASRAGFFAAPSGDTTGWPQFLTALRPRLDEMKQLPLALYYPINRVPVMDAAYIKSGLNPDSPLLDAYVGALQGPERSFTPFFKWFREREDLENEQRVQTDPSYRDRQLETVRAAVEKLVPGVSGLRIQRSPLRMVVQKEGAVLELDQLSDGEKGLLALSGDLGRRLALANPGLENPLSAEAVVLIDEIELHLHPGWQRMVVERLCQTFPNCQFIMTTHSPQVLSQVPTESVVLLDRFQRVPLPAGTLGRDSNSILAEVMGVPERPQASANRIHEIAKMIDAGELPQARQALDELEKQLGEHDSEVVRLRALMGFLES